MNSAHSNQLFGLGWWVRMLLRACGLVTAPIPMMHIVHDWVVWGGPFRSIIEWWSSNIIEPVTGVVMAFSGLEVHHLAINYLVMSVISASLYLNAYITSHFVTHKYKHVFVGGRAFGVVVTGAVISLIFGIFWPISVFWLAWVSIKFRDGVNVGVPLLVLFSIPFAIFFSLMVINLVLL